MLRINLLPPYVTQRRRTKQMLVIFPLLFAVFVVAPIVYYGTAKAHLNDVLQQADTAEAKKKATDDLKTLAASTIAQVAPIQAKLDFVEAVHKNPRDIVKLYNTLADTTPRSSFIYTDASYTASVMAIKAYSPSVEEVGRYLQAMYHEPDFQTVAVDHVPGYPDNVRNLYYLNGTLVFADGASGSSGSSGGGMSSSSGGYPGGSGSSGYPGGSGSSGGYPGSSSSSGGYPGSSGGGSSGGGSSSGGPPGFDPEHLAANGPSNVPTGVGPPPPELTGGAPSGNSSSPSSSGGYPGGQSGGGQSTGGYSPAFLKIADRGISPFALPEVREQIRKAALRRVVRKTVPKGFDINVTATLKQPITPPTLPGTAPAPGGAGGPGGRPGFGGPPGMRGGPTG